VSREHDGPRIPLNVHYYEPLARKVMRPSAWAYYSARADDEVMLRREREALEPAALTWEDVAWLRSLTGLPMVLKGILHPKDAALAVEHGARGVVVSTHGGRQLDGVQASVEALPAVVEAVAGRAEGYLDGGVRRGIDVLKALAMRVRAVFVGPPALWGLVVDGAGGVRRVMEMLREGLELAMVLAGLPDLEYVGPELVLEG
jgi:isopentenyl diphosphate isomerase/L-lactate dehydrogenase-like FMN-dependent dehydrogenase